MQSELFDIFGRGGRPGKPKPPPVVTPPPRPSPKFMRVSVWAADGGGFAVLRDGSLRFDDPNWPIVSAVLEAGRLRFLLPDAAMPGWHVQLTVFTDAGRQAFDVAVANDVDVKLAPIVPPLERLHLEGRRGFHTPAGAHVPLTGATGFRLVELVASGHESAAAAFLDAMTPARTIRVLTMAEHLFQLSPDAGRAALARTLGLAAEHGKYLSVVACADTASFTVNLRQHVREVGAICAESAACAFIEIGNELSPLHPTQTHDLGDVSFLNDLRSQIPASVAVSLGSTHADQDESDIFKDGDLLTVHGDRASGGADEGWLRAVRHTNEQRALADRLNKYVVNDEPDRQHLEGDWQLGMALLCRMFRLGDTFHFSAGLQCQPPTGAELDAFQWRLKGWAAIPDDWYGQYSNAGFAGAPAKSAVNALRVYSAINRNDAYTLVLGSNGGPVDWDDKWPTRGLVIREGRTQLWKVTR